MLVRGKNSRCGTGLQPVLSSADTRNVGVLNQSRHHTGRRGATYLLSGCVAVSSFVEFAADRRLSGIQPLMRGRGYFNAVDIYETSTQPDQQYPFDFDTFSADPTPFQLPAVRADTGETVFWGREDTPDLSALMKRVRASLTMPGFMPITYIDGHAYVDGAVGETGGLML